MFNVEEKLVKLQEQMARKDADGTLTLGEALVFGYYRILDGVNTDRVVIKAHSRINEDEVYHFADKLTWVWSDQINHLRCTRVYPTFT